MYPQSAQAIVQRRLGGRPRSQKEARAPGRQRRQVLLYHRCTRHTSIPEGPPSHRQRPLRSLSPEGQRRRPTTLKPGAQHHLMAQRGESAHATLRWQARATQWRPRQRRWSGTLSTTTGWRMRSTSRTSAASCQAVGHSPRGEEHPNG